ncbi:MAG TPA: peptidylprolyl isomerase [Catalimonadaceae bacterium]|nr:peptidylprolyl isomerase [Catalimonadaceae bacterium]
MKKINHYLLTLSLSVLSIGALAQLKSGPVVDKIVAKIDNQILLKSEVELGYLQAQQQKTGIPPAALKCKVFEQLLVNKLMLAKADIDSVTVEENMVDDQLNRRMNYMIQAIGSKEKLEAYYKKSIEQFKAELKKEVRDQMLIQKMQDAITRNLKVTPAQVKKFFNAIPKDSLPFFSTEVEVGQIVRFSKISRTRKQEARQKLEELKKRIQNGEDFGFLAKAYSQDPGSAPDGGNLGFWGRGAMVPEYEAAALKLQPNELSEIVESAFGFHLIQLLEKRGNEYSSRHILIKAEAGEEDHMAAFHTLDSLRNALIKDSITFEAAARKYSEDRESLNTGGYLTDNETGSTHIATEHLDPGIFFTIDSLKPGSFTKPLPYKSPDGKRGARILYFKSKILPHEANLKQDYTKIQAATLEQKKAESIKNWFKKTKGEVFISRDKDYSDCEVFKDDDL